MPVKILSVKENLFHFLVNEIKRITTTQISTLFEDISQKLDICFYHSKHKYHLNENYKMVSIDIDQNNKNVINYLKQVILKERVNMLMPYIDNFFWYTQEKGQQIVMGKQKLYIFL